MGSVVDTGIGIAREDKLKLFQEFSQVDSSSSRQAQRSGLGLALCKKFGEMQRRDHWRGFYSRPGLELLVYPAVQRAAPASYHY
jgi:signal transduction histidine kinase